MLVAGLDGDRFKKPYLSLLALIPQCEKVKKLTAVCSSCGNGEACFTVIEKNEENRPMCRGCFNSGAQDSTTTGESLTEDCT